ncbi:MAG: MBL fold metallo-hydrolase [Patescibacteria group bacterium]|jgi:competence protein ComEC
MKNKNKKLFNIGKKVLLVLLSISGAILMVFLIFSDKLANPQVVFLDVGQGDSALIQAPDGKTVLIDGGPDNKVLRGLGKNMPFYRRRIDFLIISHYHDDHIAGLIEVVKRYQVGALIYSGKEPDTPLMSELLKVASQHKVALRPLDNQINLSFGLDCRLDLLDPDILNIKEDPNNSLVSRLECGGRSFLFGGDNGSAVEKILLASGWLLKADIFKASHHGSNTSNSEAFLEEISPRLIIVSVGKDNRFGHPGPLFLERAATLGIPVKRTDNNGDVKIFAK